jgi:hypothetical protein
VRTATESLSKVSQYSEQDLKWTPSEYPVEA